MGGQESRNRLWKISCKRSPPKNPKAFFKYANSKVKTRSGIRELTAPDGTKTTTDKEKSEVQNSFFVSVFTKEYTTNIPCFSPKNGTSTLDSIDISPDEVKKKLGKLNPSKSAGPDCHHPRVLKELQEHLTGPLWIVSRNH